MKMVLTIAAVLFLVLSANGADAQQDTPVDGVGDTLGWHVVREGETLEGITKHYLGTSKLWPENWRLNPDVKDPNMLSIGQRLRVILSRTLPGRTAEVRKVSRRVEDKPHPEPWMEAKVGDLLKEKDGVRTFEKSSTEIGFDDGTSLVLTENSLVFLREVRRKLTGVTREQLEVFEGQAELESRPRTANSADIEILVGGVRTQPRPGSAGIARSRLRKPAEGGAQVMVYGGRADVESGGTAIEVPAGMGTAVEEGKAPAPPEKLLSAPDLKSPKPGTEISWSNPVFAWAVVPGAASYTVEVCLDSACARQVARSTGLENTAWRARKVPEGDLFWRVTATAPSGLDGFPSKTRLLKTQGDGCDREPPMVTVIPLSGAAAVDRTALEARPGARLRLEAHDDAAGVEWVRHRWDGGAWRTGEGDISVPKDEGRHRLEVEAADRAGRVMQPLVVTVDLAAQKPQGAAVFVTRD